MMLVTPLPSSGNTPLPSRRLCKFHCTSFTHVRRSVKTASCLPDAAVRSSLYSQCPITRPRPPRSALAVGVSEQHVLPVCILSPGPDHAWSRTEATSMHDINKEKQPPTPQAFPFHVSTLHSTALPIFVFQSWEPQCSSH